MLSDCPEAEDETDWATLRHGVFMVSKGYPACPKMNSLMTVNWRRTPSHPNRFLENPANIHWSPPREVRCMPSRYDDRSNAESSLRRCFPFTVR